MRDTVSAPGVRAVMRFGDVVERVGGGDALLVRLEIRLAFRVALGVASAQRAEEEVSMLGRRAGRVGMVLLLGVTTTAVAVAATTGSSDPVSGKFDVTLAGPPTFNPCGNQAVARLKATLTGTATSSDPRLAGNVRMRLRGVTDEDGPGATASTVVIRNPNTGQRTAKGTFVAVRTDDGLSGVLDAKLYGPSGHAVVVIGLRLKPADTPSGFHLVGKYGSGKTAPAIGVIAEGC
jgi:hypothetical protein